MMNFYWQLGRPGRTHAPRIEMVVSLDGSEQLVVEIYGYMNDRRFLIERTTRDAVELWERAHIRGHFAEGDAATALREAAQNRAQYGGDW